MINITPTSHYSTNFKAKTDYSKIYKEMEEISLKRDEKIIPKLTKINKHFLYNLMDKVSDIIDSFFRLKNFSLFIACILSMILTFLFKSGIERRNQFKHLDDIYVAKLDSLKNMQQNNILSVEEFKKQANEIITEYDNDIHNTYLEDWGYQKVKDDGIYTVRDIAHEKLKDFPGDETTFCYKEDLKIQKLRNIVNEYK